ncbi:proton-coupled amino acid transporter-like protein pathetic isoform X2 [Bombus vosnesenskii]|uniref:Proton-coupled amino acid transporter-like protein pathetic isoform X2 n=3 Tax=Pyrobombus TaxID=144703 RepID=A0A6J3KW48_9HYME|nr:proton-coupled amino acid transporter-like protein pathetic isoform X2 [Bombus vancouverensis nearcticus]XP_033315514.1 proton-coupled amino acid transporter-like protein pathetic isoform X2 [Bombus bifarius]XP_033357618.1 proton-coupled amino acid transporter-like protein pathetic isoform X2 [Bombus vosnesenskii]XP_050469548.1 proton-coupled amino acid transporter-like protein pathetic isoform X2 [Bombus huntii]
MGNTDSVHDVEMSSLSSTANDRSYIRRTPMRPMIAEYDPKKHGVKTELSDTVLVKYKCEKNDIPITVTNGSTLPLVERPNDEEAALYNPFEHRKLAHPTSDLDTLIHLLKGSLGTGILAMPMAFRNAGLLFGLIATFFIGAVCTYCVHILVKCAHNLCRRTQTPSLGFAEVAEAAFLVGPEPVQKYARLAKATINSFLVIDLIGCCCVYIVFISTNIKGVVDYYTETDRDVRFYMAALLPFLIAFSLVRNLKFLAPFSMIANILIATGMGITFYYIFSDLPSISDLPNFSSWSQLPLFFGTAIFALEGIGVVMSLENNMKTPTHFIGCPGVLNTGMFCVVLLYSTVGFFGYWRYGEDTKASITLNPEQNEVLAQSAKLMIAVAIFLTYGLQFYVPMEIIWKNLKQYFSSRKLLGEYLVRILMVIFTVGVAIAIPNLGPFISLVGAVCLSTLGLMFPSVIELVTVWEQENGLGTCYWRLWKNLAIILFGVLGFITGTYVSIQEIIEEDK